MTHEQLCERARRWLKGSRRCDPVFSNIASCAEIPDAIGWSSCYQHAGSVVVECKTSVADFHADRKKYIAYRRPDESPGDYTIRHARMDKDLAQQRGYRQVNLPNMGTYRFYMCQPGVLSVELVEKYMPDHGLLYVEGRRVRIVREAPRRESIDKDAEIRYLRFAIINGKESYSRGETGRGGLFEQTSTVAQQN